MPAVFSLAGHTTVGLGRKDNRTSKMSSLASTPVFFFLWYGVVSLVFWMPTGQKGTYLNREHLLRWHVETTMFEFLLRMCFPCDHKGVPKFDFSNSTHNRFKIDLLVINYKSSIWWPNLNCMSTLYPFYLISQNALQQPPEIGLNMLFHEYWPLATLAS